MKKIPQGDVITQQFRVERPGELLEFLIENKIRKSKNAIQSVLKRRLITVNGKLITQFNHPLKLGDKVAVMKVDQLKKIKRLKGMSIVYEDETILVIDKEAGLLSVATEREKLNTAYGILTAHVKKKARFGKVFILHRLDREASGLMIFAKDMDTQGKFQRNWNFLVPVYDLIGVVEGEMPNTSGTIKSWLTENKNYQVFSASFDNGGQESITHYKVLKSNEYYNMVEFKLETRRKNQLRAQLHQIQRPIVGDKKYGASSNPLKRIALHVHKMTIKHPITGQMMDFTSTTPKMISKLLDQANLNTKNE